MNVLVVAGGGREYSLAWKLKQSSRVSEIFIAPGNAGTAAIGTNLPIKTSAEIIDWLKQNKVDLVVIGHDNYLAEGLTDRIVGLGIKVFGPTQAAAEVEWSKSYAKELMREEGIPTARYKVFTDAKEAREYLQTQSLPVVIKADGLTKGKGVIIAETLKEAEDAVAYMIEQKGFGDAGREIVIEEFLEGQEISVHAFCDGTSAVVFPISKDHKRIFDGDKGPNTAGMGAIAPVDTVTPEQIKEIHTKIVEPLLVALKKRGRMFQGVLYPGVMLTKDGPKVIEFNARFGDPEAQVYMRLLTTDLLEVLLACVEGRLQDLAVEWSGQFACSVVLASKGYPQASGERVGIKGVEKAAQEKDVEIFHAGTILRDGRLMTGGGRILNVTATGETLQQALQKAYAAVELIQFEGMQYRKDIGKDLGAPSRL